MSITGRIKSMPYKYTIEDMYVGTKGYINLEYIIFTRFAVFISLHAYAISKFHVNDDPFYFVPIKRIGDGLTETDFELIVSDPYKIGLLLKSEKVYHDLIKDNENYIVFFIYEYNALNKEKKLLIYKDKLKVLRTQLQISKDKENYMNAASLRDNISDLKTKGINSLFAIK